MLKHKLYRVYNYANNVRVSSRFTSNTSILVKILFFSFCKPSICIIIKAKQFPITINLPLNQTAPSFMFRAYDLANRKEMQTDLSMGIGQ